MNKALLRKAAGELGIAIGEGQLLLFEQYFDELMAWNRMINLTAITAEEEVIVKHFCDSLLGLTIEGWSEGYKVMDVGSGAGFPGIPLNIMKPGITLSMIDSSAKKAAFLQKVITRLNLKNAAVYQGRAEELGHKKGLREEHDVVVSRAVARLPVLLEYCLPFVKPGGIFIAYKGPEGKEEATESDWALKQLKGVLAGMKEHRLPQDMGERVLIVIKKEEGLPGTYPRRAGVPAKRPLLEKNNNK